ncbi:hypothetical protein LTR35_015720 [Friedmanniomyces endolithicus]|uniref:RanBD1 domain-containing protein n=1 Tax=Friedmanniomyces endolithicus TaxID=329885 RepID=A0AAN6JDE9_9PEZI|nr:hypothetical protein LTR35_015720 [Friedmanniomyces endolithicus]KAK0293375.1 hypothetical protein LTS00_007621 [Friedmanniomyces endolithicus]KAK0325556.1 hypothetical protein LTR82_003091 [Friedmanniomyces endolithicus]KAK0979947.1 hypothetical protein LTR54_015459 [Friedmanniomyces endolithicus]
MVPTANSATHSDTETAERPVREQLKKASIAGLPSESQAPQAASQDPMAAGEPAGENGSRGRLQRKRSFEDVEDDHGEPTSISEIARQHTRKRSRDSTVEEVKLNNGRNGSDEQAREVVEAAPSHTEASHSVDVPSERPRTPKPALDMHEEAITEAFASPKTKRSRLHSSSVDDKGVGVAPSSAHDTAADKSAPAQSTTAKAAAAEGSTTEVPPTSGSANTPVVSPFGALAGSKTPVPEAPQTSSSAFTSSGFGSLAGSTSSGFGAIGKSTGGFGADGGFATGGRSTRADPRKEDVKPDTSASTFGGALGQKSAFTAAPTLSSGFGSGSSSGFGTLGNGFGSGLGGGLGNSPFGGATGGGLSTFSSSKSAAPLGGRSKLTSPKPFGAPAEEEENGDEDGGEEDSSSIRSPAVLSQDGDKQDERFYAQSLETGEEDEETEYSCRAKVYNYATTKLEDGSTKKEWRERGLGVLRFNVNRGRGEREGEKPKARFLMRADGSHRVVLNTPVSKEIKVGAPTGGPPQGGLMLFFGTVEGGSGLEMLQVKMKQHFAIELYEKILRLQSEM